MGRQFTAEWAAWVRLNVDRGCDEKGILEILLNEGFTRDQVMAQFDAIASPSIGGSLGSPPESSDRDERLSARCNEHIPGAKKLAGGRAEFYVLDDFLTEVECEELTGRIRKRLRASEIAGVGEIDGSFRTSRTCDLGVLDDPLVRDVDRRICTTIGVDASYAEVIQGQYYDVGQQFKAHTDYFEVDQLQQYGSVGGQRTYTFFVYLNDVDAGGETEFLRLGVTFKPKRGRALLWNNLTPLGAPNHDTIHRAHPVLQGYKSVITKWFRAHEMR